MTQNKSKLVLGLTGSIGCGKSSVSKILNKNGFEIIDADLIAREIFGIDSVIDSIRYYFPSVVDNKKIDRKKLGDIVFSNPEKLEILNSITHKKIREVIEERILISDYDRIIIDAALLIEAGFEGLVDKIIIIYCREEEQIKRIIGRDRISSLDAKKRIESQMSQEEKIKKADFIIDNSDSWEFTEEQINKLISLL